MTFPSSPREQFEKNPLEEVICQLRFPTILEIGTEKPAKFQNQIRDDYPLFELQHPSVPKEVADLVGRLSMPEIAGNPTFRFLSADSNRIVALSTDFVAFRDLNYKTWEQFSVEMRRAKDALEATYRPAFYTRVGLRYRNVIDRNAIGIEGQMWPALLDHSLLGLLGAPSEIGTNVEEIKTEANIQLREVPGGRVTIRHGIGERVPEGHEIYIIDADFYTAERSARNNVFDILTEFNRLSGYFFRWAISGQLRAALNPREL